MGARLTSRRPRSRVARVASTSSPSLEVEVQAAQQRYLPIVLVVRTTQVAAHLQGIMTTEITIEGATTHIMVVAAETSETEVAVKDAGSL